MVLDRSHRPFFKISVGKIVAATLTVIEQANKLKLLAIKKKLSELQPCENNAELLNAIMAAQADSAKQQQQMMMQMMTQMTQQMQQGQTNMMQMMSKVKIKIRAEHFRLLRPEIR